MRTGSSFQNLKEQNNRTGWQDDCRPGPHSIQTTVSRDMKIQSSPVTCRRRESRLPMISIFVALLSLVSYLCGDTIAFLQYDRTLIAEGELWRCLTGHFVHWSFEHFLWCTITFLALGSICEQLNRKGFIISLSISAIIIPIVSWFVAPGMLFYRGLSGICSSIFIVGSILLINKAVIDKDWINIILPAAGGLLFFVKILYEFISGQTVFVHSNDIFSPVPLAHLSGAMAGLVSVAFILFQTKQKHIH